MALSNVQGKQVTRRTRVDSSGQGTSRHESDKGPSYYQKTSPKPRPSGQPTIHSPPPDREAAQVEAHMEVNAGFGSPSSDQREASLVTSSADSQTSAIGREACTREGRRTGREYAALADVPRARRISQRQAFDVERRRLEQRLRTRSPGRDEVERIFGQERRKVQAPAKFGRIEDQSRAGCNYNVAPRRGRSACRAEKGIHEKVYEPECASPKSISQRSRSLDRRSTKSTEVDLAGKAKRGWLARMDGDGQWLKNWFLLADNVLLYFRDSTGKEQSAADGEFELSSCCGVTEIQVHKGYGFQVQFEGSAIILAAATAGIRRSWMEDILRSIPGQPDRESCHPASSPSGADKALKQLLGQQSVNRPGALDNHIKTLDWSEFRTVRQALEKVSAGTQAHEKYNDWGDYLDLSSPEPPLKSVAWEAVQRVEQKENTVGVNHVTRTRCIPLADDTCTSILFSHAAKQSMEIDASQTKTFGLNASLHPSNDTFKVSREEKSGGSSSILDSQRSPLPSSLNKPIPLRLVTVQGPSQFLPPTPIRKPGDGARTDGDKTGLGSTVLPRSHLHQKVKIWSGDANYGNACVDLVERPPPAGDEIEQHWEQVEKTPVNGQKQIAISCIRPSTPGSVGEAHYQALNEQVEKLQEELEQVRKELGLLQKENCDLQTKLQQQKNLSGYISQAACERGLAAMQESHRIALAELQRQKDQELQAQREEQERLLVEEAAATAAALEVMQNAHRTELERVLQAQHSSSSSSSERTDAFRRQQEELTSAQRELGVLSEQYSQKCLENSHLSQALEAERQALRHCQQENQALNAQNQKLNSRLSQELRRLRSIVTGDGDGKGQLATSTSPATYELEVMVRVKDSEIQYYKQEMNTLKEQLQAALREKKYAAEKYKDIYMEMSIVRAKAEMDAGRLQEKLVAARRGLPQDVMRTESNPDLPRIEDANVSPRPVDSCHHQSLGERNNLRELYYQEKEE